MAKNRQALQEKLLKAAEGYMELGMHEHALSTLNELPEPDTISFQVHLLRGEILRAMERYKSALESFEQAFEEKPEHVELLLAMAWCWKRTDQLPRAIAAMEQAYRIAPSESIVLYNLSCYWALAGNKTQALSWLGRALRMNDKLRKSIPDEHDFDLLRHDPDFQLIVGASDHAG